MYGNSAWVKLGVVEACIRLTPGRWAQQTLDGLSPGEVSSPEKLAERIEGDSSDGRSDPHVLLGASLRSANRFTRRGSYVLTDDGSIPSKSEQVVKVTVFDLSAVDYLPS
ncbi:hypothetical protein TNCT_405981 [Trichonephila clavata]|uniref:Uncharacterized protein n=1 Tax=Trichonephila clavata TaxID=2740835 RepID=A0A8X6FB64_TRICU|nr:hypothetical protein TNCT_405981 [Trichonephila clavata]